MRLLKKAKQCPIKKRTPGLAASEPLPTFATTTAGARRPGRLLTNTAMNSSTTTLRPLLTGRLSGTGVKLLAAQLRRDDAGKAALFALLNDADKRVADNAAWLLSHIAGRGDAFFDTPRRHILRTAAMRTGDDTLRRLLLTVLYAVGSDPAETEPAVDFLDFCLAGVASTLPAGTRALCLKLALRICLPYPELRTELRMVMAQAEDGEVPPALAATLRAARRQLKQQRYRRTRPGR